MKILYYFIAILLFFNAVCYSLKDGEIKLHLIPHSHCDSGWTSTMNEYYMSQVKSIISSMVQALNIESNPPRKFVWSEIGFLEQWWDDMPIEIKNDFTKHVKNDRIEFVNGGWVMNDEACASLESVIRHLSNGHKFIREKFGKQPESGWQIDPFGHSSLTPTLQAQFGYKHIVLNRIHYELKKKFRDEKNLQFKWRGSPDGVGPKSDILAHVFDDFYTSPPHMSFDGYNFLAYGLPRLTNELIELARNRSIFYKSPHVLIPMGGDFAYRNAYKSFEQMDQLVASINGQHENGQSNVVCQYSTLADFFSDTIEWHNQNKVAFNYYDGDFFPYADDFNTYWTGYYTSRPLLKGYERHVSSKLRSAEILSALQSDEQHYPDQLLNASKQVSILQHHDAISGTSKKHVVQDYLVRLQKADVLVSEESEKLFASALSEHSPTKLDIVDIGGSLNFPTNNDAISFSLFNQLSWMKEELITIKVQSDDTSISTGNGCPYVLAQDDFLNEIEIDCSPRSDFKNDQSDDHKEFIQIDFPAKLKPFSSKLYYLKRKSNPSKSNWVVPTTNHLNSIENNLYVANLDENYLIKSLQSKAHDHQVTEINQQLLTYQDVGGAYIFRTNKQVYQPPRQVYSTFSYLGKFYQEAQSVLQDTHQVSNRYGYGYYYGGNNQQDQTYSTFNYNSIKMINTGNEMIDKKINFNFHIKGINGTTTINRFTTDIDNNRELYSDNGLEMMHRKSITSQPTEIGRETQSYYPTINSVYIESHSSGKRLVCNNDRSRGVSSQGQGCLEMALHRSLTYEDGKGLEIPAIDESSINARFECYLDVVQPNGDDIRKQSINYQHKFQIYQGQDSAYMSSKSYMLKPLPEFIHILSMERSGPRSIKLRIHNIENNGQAPITFDLNGLFSFIKSIKSIKEYNLSLINRFVDNNIDDIFTSHRSIVGKNLFPIKDTPIRFNPINTKQTKITLHPSEIKAIEISYH
ncbi:hypothetical protein RB653_008043 [Dictyostelium firmibasis]|uniref:alpha-mannosidase n=1 Tax=Dictyostelium firmibasis TaxID=79012 RepID=A0AAN7UC02_9MYCE